MTEVEQPPQNGIDVVTDDEDLNKSRPADIEQDMREMERRKRVEAIMGSRLFREELERIVDSQIREGGASGILQQLSDIVGVPASRVGSVFKSSNCVLPINDIRGVESMGYSKGEKILRCKLAATFRLLDLYGWTQGLGAQITARLMADQELFLVNPFGLLYHEVTASSLNKADMQGNIVEQGTTNFGINTSHYILHTVVHAARPDIRCAIYVGCNPVVAVSSLKIGLLPLTKDSAVLGEIAIHPYTGALNEPEEREKLIRSLGPNSKVLLLNNHGALCCGETIEEAFYAAYHIVQACETQLKLLPVGLDNLVLIPEEVRKTIYDASRRPPEGFEHIKLLDSNGSNNKDQTDNKLEQRISQQKPKWRVGGAEYEALMRMLDNAGFRTGYIYRHPLVKSDVPKPKNDVEVPPAVSSLGYLLEEEELYRQGVWKKSDLRKGGDRSRWLNSPNVYQKVEVLETGTPDPKKITKWVADGSPTHSTAVRIDNALQFVPPGTNPKEFKKLQQQIKDNRRADKISAGPQSHILEGVTWDEANRIKDASVSQTGDHVVLMGAASKGIIQRGYQHNATVYKAPYAKNPFDNVTDDELNEYKRTVSKKKSVHGEYTDTDFSESEALSSTLNTSGAQQKSSLKKTILTTQSEPEDAEAHVLRIETKQAPKPSQPEVVLSDADSHSDTHSNSISFRKRLSSFLRATNDFISNERSHTATNKKPPTGRANNKNFNKFDNKNFKIHYNSPTRSINNQLTAINNKQNTNLISNCTNNHNNEICTQSVLTNWRELIYPTISSRNALKELSSIKTNFIREDGTNTGYDLISSDEFYSLPDNFEIELPNSTAAYSCRDSSKIVQKFQNPYYDDGNADDENLNIFLYGDKRYLSKTSKPLNLHSQSVADLNNDFQDINDYYEREINSEPNSPFRSPYRTVSHFGFNCPVGFIQPEHKHIPITPTKYIPLKREMSYDEVFASPRYVEASEYIFNNVLKRKAFDALRKNRETNVKNGTNYENSPEKKRFKLSPPTLTSTTNAVELYDSNDDSLLDVSDSDSPVDMCNTFEIDVQFLDILEKQAKLHEDIGQLQNLYDTMNLAKLDPILEEVSSDIDELTSSNQFENDDDTNVLILNNNDEYSTVPSFIKKIVQMNYTEESPNLNFIPQFTSETSDFNTSLLAHNKTHSVAHSVAELDEQLKELSSVEEEHHGSETRIEETKYVEKNKIMNRAERSQRQEEFYELWEDHLNFYGSTDDPYNSDNEEFYSITNIPNNSQDFEKKTEFDINKDENVNWNNNEPAEVYDSQVTISRLENIFKNQEILINKNKEYNSNIISSKPETYVDNSYEIIPTLDEIMDWKNPQKEYETYERILIDRENMKLENYTKQGEKIEKISTEKNMDLKNYDKQVEAFKKIDMADYDKQSETLEKNLTEEYINLENDDKQSETLEKTPTEQNIDLENYDIQVEAFKKIDLADYDKQIETLEKNLPEEYIDLENDDKQSETLEENPTEENIDLDTYDKQVEAFKKIDLDDYDKLSETLEKNLPEEYIDLENDDKQSETLEQNPTEENIDLDTYDKQVEAFKKIDLDDYDKLSETLEKNPTEENIDLENDDKQIETLEENPTEENIDLETYNKQVEAFKKIDLDDYDKQSEILEKNPTEENIDLENDDKQSETLAENPTDFLNQYIDLEAYDKQVEAFEKIDLDDYDKQSETLEKNLTEENIDLENDDEQSETLEENPTEENIDLETYDKQVEAFKKIDLDDYDKQSETLEKNPTEENIDLENDDKQMEAGKKIPTGGNFDLKKNYKQNESLEKFPNEEIIIDFENDDTQSENSIKISTEEKLISLENYDEQIPSEYEIFDFDNCGKNNEALEIATEKMALENYDIERKVFSKTLILNKNFNIPDKIVIDSKEEINEDIFIEDGIINLKNFFIENQISTQTLVDGEIIELENLDKQTKEIEHLPTENIVQFKRYDKKEMKKNPTENNILNINNQHETIDELKNKEEYTFGIILDEIKKLETNEISKLEHETSEENIVSVCNSFELDNEEAASSEQNIRIRDYDVEEQNDYLREMRTEDEIIEIYNILKLKETFKKIPSKAEILKIFSEINNFESISETIRLKESEGNNFENNVDVERSMTETLVQNNQQTNTHNIPILNKYEKCTRNFDDIEHCREVKSNYSESEFVNLFGSGKTINNVLSVEPDIFSSEEENVSDIFPEKCNMECADLNLNDNSVLKIVQSKLIKNHINISDKISKSQLDSNDFQESESLDGIQSLNSDTDEQSTAKISGTDQFKNNVDFLSPQSNVTEYKSVFVSTDDKDLTGKICSGCDENSFNSIELKILRKIEENNFNKKGTIFNKIDNEIRSKITPGKIEKILSDSDSCPSKSLPYSSTPTFVITESASYESFYSLNLSEVKAANEMRKKTKLRLKQRKSATTTPNTTQESFSPTSSSISGGTDGIEDKKSTTKIKKSITRNVNRVNNVHRAKFSRSPSPVVLTTQKEINSPTSSNIVSRYSPTTTAYTIKRRQRNFITENIRNVSSSSTSRSSFIERYRKANVGAIFSKNPFGQQHSNEQKRRLIESATTSLKNNNRKLGKSLVKSPPQQSNDYYNSIYPFQSKQTVKGSPKLWVSMSPQYKKPTKLFKTECDTFQSKLHEEQIDNSNNDNLSLLVDVACSNINVNINSATQVSNAVNSLDEATKTLAKIVEKYDENVEKFSNHVAKLNENLNDCQQIQEEIEDERQELRISMAQSRREENLTYDMLTYSISEEDD